MVNCARARAGPTRELSIDADPTDEHISTRNGHEDAGALRLAIAALPERQRLVLFLRYYADLDYTSIASALEISSGTVGATLNAAHRALRPLIEEVSHDRA